MLLSATGAVERQGSYDVMPIAAIAERASTPKSETKVKKEGVSANTTAGDERVRKATLQAQDLKRRTGGTGLYRYYARSIGSFVLALFAVVNIIYVFTSIFPCGLLIMLRTGMIFTYQISYTQLFGFATLSKHRTTSLPLTYILEYTVY